MVDYFTGALIYIQSRPLFISLAGSLWFKPIKLDLSRGPSKNLDSAVDINELAAAQFGPLRATIYKLPTRPQKAASCRSQNVN